MTSEQNQPISGSIVSRDLTTSASLQVQAASQISDIMISEYLQRVRRAEQACREKITKLSSQKTELTRQNEQLIEGVTPGDIAARQTQYDACDYGLLDAETELQRSRDVYKKKGEPVDEVCVSLRLIVSHEGEKVATVFIASSCAPTPAEVIANDERIKQLEEEITDLQRQAVQLSSARQPSSSAYEEFRTGVSALMAKNALEQSDSGKQLLEALDFDSLIGNLDMPMLTAGEGDSN